MPQPSELFEQAYSDVSTVMLRQKRMVREQPDGLHVIVARRCFLALGVKKRDQRGREDAIMIFRESIRPEWEDKMNTNGGHFQFQLKPSVGGGQARLKRLEATRGQVDEYWNNLVLGVIGATIEPANMITGIRLVGHPMDIRRGFQVKMAVFKGRRVRS